MFSDDTVTLEKVGDAQVETASKQGVQLRDACWDEVAECDLGWCEGERHLSSGVVCLWRVYRPHNGRRLYLWTPLDTTMENEDEHKYRLHRLSVDGVHATKVMLDAQF